MSDPSSTTPHIVNVARFLPESASKNPGFCAVRAPAGRDRQGNIRYHERTFAELDAESNATANYLRQCGARQGMRVLLMVRPGLDLIRLCFALFKLGAVPVVIDPGMGLRKFVQCVARSQPEMLAGITAAHAVSRIFPAAFASVRHRFNPSSRKYLNALAHADLHQFALAPTSDRDLAAILFTSGSTGPPKGVCYEHGMFEAQVRLLQQFYNIQPGEVDLPMLPVFALFNPAMGMTTVVPEMNPSRPARADPRKIVQAIQQNSATNSFGSPALWTLIARHCQREKIVLPTLKRVLMAGAPLPPGLAEAMREILPNGDIHTPYGATESLPVSSISGAEIIGETLASTRAGRGTCVGRPIPEISIRIIQSKEAPIVNLKDTKNLAAGEIGEIIVKGPVVTRAYDALPEATASAKIRNAATSEADDTIWHRMGDVGYLDGEGRLWFCGRKAERVQTTDAIYFTEQVEPVFLQHPRVKRCALIGVTGYDNYNHTVPGLTAGSAAAGSSSNAEENAETNGLDTPPAATASAQQPALAIEPEPGQFPRHRADRRAFVEELLAIADTAVKEIDGFPRIERFFFCRAFPVDVRHNAKIHRLTLAQRFSQ